MGDILNDKVPDRSFSFDEGNDVSLPSLVPRMSDSEVRKAMREVGLTQMNVRRWRAMEKVGRILTNLGAINVGMGEYVISNQIRDEVIQKCRTFLNDAKDSETVAALAIVINTLASAKDATTKQIVDAARQGLIQKPDSVIPPPSPGKRVRIVATEIVTDVPPKQLSQ